MQVSQTAAYEASQLYTASSVRRSLLCYVPADCLSNQVPCHIVTSSQFFCKAQPWGVRDLTGEPSNSSCPSARSQKETWCVWNQIAWWIYYCTALYQLMRLGSVAWQQLLELCKSLSIFILLIIVVPPAKICIHFQIVIIIRRCLSLSLCHYGSTALWTLFFFIWFVRLLALRPLLAYCASLGW
jgi:hypothetical protein